MKVIAHKDDCAILSAGVVSTHESEAEDGFIEEHAYSTACTCEYVVYEVLEDGRLVAVHPKD